MIEAIRIVGFRGIAQELALSFGDISLLSGRNGLGKTTVIEAIDWCLFGDSWKTSEERAAVTNLYTAALKPRVEAVVRLNGDRHVIVRETERLTVDGDHVTDRELTEIFVRDPDLIPPYARDVDLRIRRFTYLPQEEVRTLVSAEGVEERRAVLQSILGVPNAQLVTSSIKRVEQRLADRLESLQTAITDVHGQMQEIWLNATPVLQHGAPDVETAIREATERLGIEPAGDIAPQEILQLVRAEIRRIVSEKKSLEEFSTYRADIVAQMDAERIQVSQAEVRREAIRGALESAEADLRACADETQRCRAAVHESTLAADLASQRLEPIRELIVRLKQAKGFSEGIRDRERRLGELQEQIAASERSLQDQERSVASMASALRAHEEEVRQAEGRRLQSQELQNARRMKSELKSRVEVLNDQAASYAQQLDYLTEELTRARGIVAGAEEEIKALAVSHVEEMTASLSLLAEALEGIATSECPICGANYESHEELMEHVRAKAMYRSSASNRLVELRGRATGARARAAEVNADIGQIRSAAGAVADESSAATHELRRVESEVDRLSALIPPDSGSLELVVRSVSERVVRDRTELNRIREAASAAVVRLEERRSEHEAVTRELVLLRERLTRVSAGAQGNDVDQQLMDAEQQLRDAETAYVSASQARGEADRHVKGALQKERQVADVVAAHNASLAGMKGRLARLTDLIRAKESELQSRTLQVLGVSQVDDLAFSEQTSAKLSALAQREAALKTSAASLDAIVLMMEQEDRGRRLAELRDQERRVSQDVEQVEYALARFGHVAAELRSRANNESGKAIGSLEEAIQYLFRSLYPHRHLDEVRLRHEPAEVLLADQYLNAPVRPDLYVSTGQLSILALAVVIGASLRQRLSRLRCLILDEPVQNLDDLHFLAFITLIRRVALSRQVIMATADANIAELFRRQMKSTAGASASSYVQYEWRTFDPQTGPIVDIVEDLRPHSRAVSGAATSTPRLG